MRIGAVVFAVEEYRKIRDELAPLLQTMGPKALTIHVRQKGKAEDLVWLCQDIGYDTDDEVFWAVYVETHGAQGRAVTKQFKVVLDIDTIDAIAFETFETVPQPDDEDEEEREEDEDADG